MEIRIGGPWTKARAGSLERMPAAEANLLEATRDCARWEACRREAVSLISSPRPYFIPSRRPAPFTDHFFALFCASWEAWGPWWGQSMNCHDSLVAGSRP